MKDEIVLALKAKIDIGIGISVDAYMLPDGAIRYGQDYISLLLGYSEGYVSQLGKKSRQKLEALRRIGFTADVIPVKVSRSTGGATRPKTLSFDDFCIFVEYEAREVQNPKAIALLAASFREIVEDRTFRAFGLVQKTLEEKLESFSKAFSEREQVYAELRQEQEELWLPGDTESYPDLCDWEDYRSLLEKKFDYDFDDHTEIDYVNF